MKGPSDIFDPLIQVLLSCFHHLLVQQIRIDILEALEAPHPVGQLSADERIGGVMDQKDGELATGVGEDDGFVLNLRLPW